VECPGRNGYASYKVADTVTTHQAEGLGVYSVLTNDVTADDAIETPTHALQLVSTFHRAQDIRLHRRMELAEGAHAVTVG
jgi:hypothetical protein